MIARRSVTRGRAVRRGQAAVLVEVVALVGIQTPGFAAGTPPQTPDRRNGVGQGQELGDVVPVATGERDGERGSVTVVDRVVLRARADPIDGRGSDVVPPFSARTCDPSTERSSRSSRPARRRSVNKAVCRRGRTPASVQSRSRRQAVTPGTPHCLRGDVTPRDTGPQYIHGAAERRSIASTAHCLSVGPRMVQRFHGTASRALRSAHEAQPHFTVGIIHMGIHQTPLRQPQAIGPPNVSPTTAMPS